jgi:hypothetical protein
MSLIQPKQISEEGSEIKRIINDKTAFINFIYTPLDVAISELKNRYQDDSLMSFVSESLNNDVPDVVKDGMKLVYSRHVVTTNYEVWRFLSIADALEYDAVFWEYLDDKFTSNNKCKYFLGRMPIYMGTGKKGGEIVECKNIIDFNKSNGRPISSVKTLWGDYLVNFHHKLLRDRFNRVKYDFFDASEWFSRNGKSAKEYYKNFLKIFLCHGILFDNFLADNSEMQFTEQAFLPAFIDIYQQTGKKPLIVALEPTDIENDNFWHSYPPDVKKIVEDNMGINNV